MASAVLLVAILVRVGARLCAACRWGLQILVAVLILWLFGGPEFTGILLIDTLIGVGTGLLVWASTEPR